MACVAFEEALSASIDGELPPREAARMSGYMAACETCNRTFEAYRQTSILLRSLDHPETPRHLTNAALRACGPARRGEFSAAVLPPASFGGALPEKSAGGALVVAATALLVVVLYRGEFAVPENGAAGKPASVDHVASAGSPGVNILPAIVCFTASDEQFSVVRPAPIFAAPSRNASQQLIVKRGTRIEVIAKSQDRAWAWIATDVGSPAYISMSDLAHSS